MQLHCASAGAHTIPLELVHKLTLLETYDDWVGESSKVVPLFTATDVPSQEHTTAAEEWAFVKTTYGFDFEQAKHEHRAFTITITVTKRARARAQAHRHHTPSQRL